VIPKVGPSTIAILTGALITMVAFIDTWIEGNPSTTLAAISAALTAALGAIRSWQAVSADKEREQSNPESQSES
jgi:secreted protein with Ig-like and vWFA domain